MPREGSATVEIRTALNHSEFLFLSHKSKALDLSGDFLERNEAVFYGVDNQAITIRQAKPAQ